MAYTLKDHEIQRVSKMLLYIGWKVVDKKVGDRVITLTIERILSDELLAAAGELPAKSVLK